MASLATGARMVRASLNMAGGIGFGCWWRIRETDFEVPGVRFREARVRLIGG